MSVQVIAHWLMLLAKAQEIGDYAAQVILEGKLAAARSMI